MTRKLISLLNKIIEVILTSTAAIFCMHCIYIVKVLRSATSPIYGTNCCVWKSKKTCNNNKKYEQIFHLISKRFQKQSKCFNLTIAVGSFNICIYRDAEPPIPIRINQLWTFLCIRSKDDEMAFGFWLIIKLNVNIDKSNFSNIINY